MKRIIKELKDVVWRRHLYRYDYFCGTNTIGEALRVLWFMWWSYTQWVEGSYKDYLRKFEKAVAEATGYKHAVAFGAGRQALFAILQGLRINRAGSQYVQLQPYTCVAVPDAITVAGGIPDYVDIESGSPCMDPDKLREAIKGRKNLWAVIFQYTFGMGNPYFINMAAKEANVPVVMDMAHTIQKRVKGVAAFVSTDHTKFINANGGGVALTDDPELASYLAKAQAGATKKTRLWALWCALTFVFEVIITHPRLYWFCKPLRHAMNRLGLFSFSRNPGCSPARMTNIQAFIGCMQMAKLEANKAHRHDLTGCNGGKLRFVLDKEIADRVPDKYFTRGAWFDEPVFGGHGGYKQGECPAAEMACKNVGTLPIHPRVNREHFKRWGLKVTK